MTRKLAILAALSFVGTVFSNFVADSAYAQTVNRFRVTSSLAPGIFTSKAEAEAAQRAVSAQASILQQIGSTTNENTKTYTYAAVPQTIEPVRGPESFRANDFPNFSLQNGPVFSSEEAVTQAVVDARVAGAIDPPAPGCPVNVSDLFPWFHLNNWIFQPIYGLTDSKDILITWSFVLNPDGSCGQQTGGFSTPAILYRSYQLSCPNGYTLNNADDLCENLLTATITEVNLDYDLEPEECVGNPCNPWTGTEILTFQDVKAPGIVFERVWRSRVSERIAFAGDPVHTAEFGKMPYGWSFSYGQRVLFNANGVPDSLYRPNGTLVPLQESTNAAGVYFAANGSELQLRESATDEWAVFLRNGSTEIYKQRIAPACTDGVVRLESVIDHGGRVTNVEYSDACSRAPITIRGPFGHTVQIQYQPFVDASTPRSIAAVIGSDGQTIAYDYTLTTFAFVAPIQVLDTATYQDGSIETYHYEQPNFSRLITGITDEENIRLSTYSYDLAGRAASTSWAGGHNSWTFDYRTNGEIHATNARGAKTVYIEVDSDFDGAGDRRLVVQHGVVVKDTTNDDSNQQRRSSITDSNQLTTSLQYDDFHLVATSISGPAATRTFEYEYLNETSELQRFDRGPSICDDGTIPARQKETERTYVAGTQLLSSVIERGFRKDVSGNCVAIERTTTYSNYNAFGQPRLIDGPRADVVDTFAVTYNECTTGGGCGRPAHIDNALGQRWTFDQYGDRGNLRNMTRPDGVKTEYIYDLRNRQTAIVDTSSDGTETRTTAFSYYNNGLIRRATDPNGAYFEYFYDDARNLKEIHDAVGNRVLYDYDLMRNRTLERYVDASAIEHFRRSYRYDFFEHVDREFRPAPGGAADYEWQWVSDASGLLESVTSPLGNVTNFLEYDDFRNLTVLQDASGGVAQFEYDVSSNLISATGPNSALTGYEYDDFGKLTKEVSADRGTLVYTRDVAGNRVSELDARGALTTYSYDALNRLILIGLNGGGTIAYEYDVGTNAVGRLGKITGAGGTTEWTYDSFGAVAQKIQTIGAVALTTGYAYDPQGRLSSLTLPSGKIVNYSYNVFQANQVSVDGQTILSGATYEPFGSVNRWTWGNGDVSSRDFDLRGLMTSFTLAGDTRVLGYDADGRVTSAADGRSHETYSYNQLDRLTNFDSVNSSASGPAFAGPPVLLTSIQTMNNEVGAVPTEPSSPWLTVATKNVTAASAKVSLERGQVNTGSVDVKEKIGYVAIEMASGGSFVDSGGNTVSYEAQTTPEFILGWGTGCFETAFLNTYANKPVVMASLNSHNGGDGGWLRRCKLNKTTLGLTVDEDKFGDPERRHNNAESAGLVAFSAAFDAIFTDQGGTWGMEIAKITLPSTATNPVFASVSFRQSYATKPVVIVLPNKSGSNPASVRIHNVTKNGFEVVQVEAAPSDGTHSSMPIHYLAIETGSHTLPDGTRLEVGRKSTKKQKHGAGVVGQEGWATVNFGNNAPTLMTQVFDYDNNGNRTFVTEGGATSSYSYLANSNRLLSTTGPAVKTMSYDASGNVIADGSHTYGYDDLGRLADVDLGAAIYQHNGQGQRVRKDNGEITLFAYDESGGLIGEYDSLGNAVREYVWFDGASVAILAGTNVYFVHTDQLGAPRAISDGSTVIWRWESDPFGVTAAQEDPDGDSISFTCNLRFPGQYYDAETGLHYNYYRTYDPSTGRYMESDPIGLVGGPNTYTYAGSSPAMMIDLFGLDFHVYHYPAAGRGYGHSGMIFPNADGTYTQYSQGARNPEADALELLRYKEDAVVNVSEHETFPQPNAELVLVPTDQNDTIRDAIDDYIENDAPYHPITNNCVDFITDTANEADDVDIESSTIPNDFFDDLVEKYGGQSQAPR